MGRTYPVGSQKIPFLVNFFDVYKSKDEGTYRIVASASPSQFEAHVGLLILLMKGLFEPYVL